MAAQAKSIKGITIEIAGNTKKLTDALKGVDGTTRELAGNLKQVDKLLDMDPGNAELLGEKYESLSSSVALTSAKLETLKSVQDQIDRQYRDGDIGQRAYLEFRGELMRTEKKLETLRDESKKVETALNNTGGEARDTAGDFDLLKDSAGGAAESFGSEGWGKIAGVGLTGLVGGVAAVGTALVGAVESTQDYREEMAKLDVSFSTAKLSADAADEAYRILFRTTGETDQSVEAAQQIALLANSTEDVVAWASLAPGVVARFGDALQPETFYESANETLKLGEATGAYVQLLEGTGTDVEEFNKGLAACTTEEEKLEYMLGVTNGLLGDAAGEFEILNADVMAARDADAKLTEATALLGEAFAPVVTGAKNVAAEFLEGLVPAVETTISWFGDMVDSFKEKAPEMTEAAANATDEFLVSQGLAADGFFDLGQSFAATLLGMEHDYTRIIGEIENSKWSIPKPKVPKFNISGSFNFYPPSVPRVSVEYNAQGGIMTGATLFGMLGGKLQVGGEAGPEAILPLDGFYKELEAILTQNHTGGPTVYVEAPQFTVYAQANQNPDELAAQMADSFTDELERRLAGFG